MLGRSSNTVIYILLSLALAACGDKAVSDPRTKSPLVRSTLVYEAGATSRSFTGTIAAKVQSDLGFRIPGKVVERLVDPGQTVKRGQVLMKIDPSDIKLAALAQQEMVAAAKAKAKQAAEEESRYRDLRGTGAISASAYDQVKAASDAAQAQLTAAIAQAEVSRNAIGYAELVADSDGVIMETLAERGQVVSPGQTVVRLAHAGRREAIVQLPEILRPSIGSTAQAKLFGNDGAISNAKLRQLSDTADKFTRTFEARFVLDGPLADAPLGSTVTIQIASTVKTEPSTLQIPIGAIFNNGKQTGVWVITGEPAKVTWRLVTIRQLNDETAFVTGNLHRGERIVSLGAHLLRDGEPVRVAAGDLQ